MRSVAALALTATALVGCSRAPPPSGAAAHRVVSLGPATTEALFAIGAGDRVVGRSHYCDYPPEATRLPDVGGMQPDVEAILALHPDLVVGPSGGWSSRIAETLQARGVAAWFPAEITSLAGVDGELLALGERTGHGADARALVARLDAREGEVERAVAVTSPPRALLVVALAPVVVAGPGTFAHDLLRRAGAANVVAGNVPWPHVGFEQIAELDPDVIVDVSVVESGGATRITMDAPGWGGLRAVREGRVLPVADERVLRPGPRVAEGLAVLARALHPAEVR